jgi:2-succinyl-5-enolpyruvyl-6-hydroxy-3-cyclohexene-1-carboxylate synthase
VSVADSSEATYNPASLFAARLLSGLISQGVTDFVVCSGSRSQALALAAAAAEHDAAARVHVKTDERAAGYFALGVARETGRPAPVIVTSGTAVANLMPAIVEAHASRAPLMLLTADRPEELHGIRANQTLRQAEMFAGYARYCTTVPAPGSSQHQGSDAPSYETAEAVAQLAKRAYAASVGGTVATQANAGEPASEETAAMSGAGLAGPVHLNLMFRDPLSGTAPRVADLLSENDPEDSVDCAVAPDSEFTLETGEGAVVIAGAGAGKAAEDFAHRAGIPLLAEVVSGARFGRQAIMAYETLLAGSLGDSITRAIVFGHPTLGRGIPKLMQRLGDQTVVVDRTVHAEHFDPSRRAQIVTRVGLAPDYDRRLAHNWLGAWIVPDRKLRQERSTLHEPDLEAARATGYKERNAYAREQVAVKRAAVSRELLVDTVWRASWPHDRLVVAASRLVRVLDAVAAPRPVRIYANRGLAGIDGNIATALGIAVAQQSSGDPALAAGVTRLIIGDLAFLHDVSALQFTPDELRPRLQIIVGNDGGGTIFESLEVAGVADPQDFQRVQLTPQNVNIQALAQAYGWQYQHAKNRGELEELFTAPVNGPVIIEVPLQE